MNLCKILKQKRDAEQRLRQSDPAKAVIVSENDEGQSSANPAKPRWNDIQGKPTIPERLIDLIDTPASYEGQAGKALVVNSIENGLAFGASGGDTTTGAFDFGSITEASSYTWDWGSLT